MFEYAAESLEQRQFQDAATQRRSSWIAADIDVFGSWYGAGILVAVEGFIILSSAQKCRVSYVPR